MCQHPGALHIAFGDPLEEHDLLLMADLLPSPPTLPTMRHEGDTEKPTATTKVAIPLSHSPIRVISDIDDTIKFSSVLSGARAIFYNVFVKELTDLVIPGMGEWYSSMWKKGVRFHYVVRIL
jgi:phosphatidate phosphatase APP1